MKVLVNLLFLVPGVVGGTEQYATSVLRRLAGRPEVDLTLVTTPGFPAAHPDLCSAFRVVVAPLPPGRHVVRRVATEWTWLADRIGRWAPDVVHHVGGVLPPGRSRGSVVTLHDLQYRRFPQYFSRVKRGYLTAVTRQSLQRASVVTTPSEFTRSDLLAWLPLPPSQVLVAPPAPIAAGTLSPGPDDAARQEVAERLGLGRRWVHYPAATYPHKNHLVLLEAFARLAADVPDVSLVLTGATGAGAWGSAASTRERLDRAVRATGLASRVLMPGYLTREDYGTVLRGASAMAFPSRFEGYGLPVVEAMAAGVPVLASDCTALPEVVGDDPQGALLLPPDDAAAWSAALRRVLTDSRHRDVLAGRALARARQIAAVDVAGATIASYRSAAAA